MGSYIIDKLGGQTMAWTPFGAEAVGLDTKLRKLQRERRTSETVQLIVDALERGYRSGPSNVSYEQFDAETRK